MNYYEMLLARKLAKGELPPNAYLLKEASGSLVSFPDGADLPMPSFTCNITANQDLHGYDAPWVGGAGKNKLPMTVDGIKAANTGGTWNGNAYTINGVTFTILTDSDGNVTGINVKGTASDTADLILAPNYNLGQACIMTGCPSDGSYISYVLNWQNNANDVGSGITINNPSQGNVRIQVMTGVNINKTFYPMIRLATEADATFAPYSNICPISGHTGVDAWVRGKNLAHLANGTRSGQGIDVVVSNEIISASGTANTTYANLNYFNPLNVEKGKTYTVMLSKAVSHNIVFRFATDTSDTIYKQITVNAGDTKASFVADNNYFQFRLYIGTLTAGTEVNISDLQILVGYGNVESFEPYNPNSQTIQVSWQNEAGEVFGGYVDLVSGVLTVTHKGLVLTDTDYTWNIGTWSSGYRYYTSNRITEALNNQSCQTSIYKKVANITIYEGIAIDTAANSNKIDVRTKAFSSLANWKTYLASNPVDVMYELETPITYQLTPTQIKSLKDDITNAWCSTGDVILEYFGKGAE